MGKTKKQIKPDYSEQLERRKHLRIPVHMELTLKVNIETAPQEAVYEAKIIDFSRGGVRIEWGGCTECTGYKIGGIHPACIFASYSDDLKNSSELTFSIDMPGSCPPVVFKGRVIYTYRRAGKEEVGVMFSQISEADLNALENLVVCGDPYGSLVIGKNMKQRKCLGKRYKNSDIQ